MNWAHEPQDVACSTASQAWNIAESREPPVPRPPLLTHAASPTVPATVRAPANTRAGRMRRLKLRIVLRSLQKQKDSEPGTLPEIAVVAHGSVPHFSGENRGLLGSRGSRVTQPQAALPVAPLQLAGCKFTALGPLPRLSG